MAHTWSSTATSWFDLPFVVIVYFALARRNPMQGAAVEGDRTLRGRALPITPSASTASPRQPSAFWQGPWAFASTSTITPSACCSTSRSPCSPAPFIFVTRFLLGLAIDWSWLTELLRAVGNSVIALVLFPLLDRLQIRD